MNEEIVKKLSELFHLMPILLQETLEDMDWQDILNNTAEAFKLDDVQRMWLIVHTTLVLSGAREPDLLFSDLKEKTGLPDDTIRAIGTKILQELFVPLNEELILYLDSDEQSPLEERVAELLENSNSSNESSIRYQIPKKRTPLVPQKPRKMHYDGSDPYHEPFSG